MQIRITTPLCEIRVRMRRECYDLPTTGFIVLLCAYLLDKMFAQAAPEPFMSTSDEVCHLVKVLPIEDGWCVAVGRGHYAQPLSKQDAIRRAMAIARSMQASEIGVYDEGILLESIAC